RSGWISPA
ncbi:hypothetical protein BVN1_03080, partial [Bacillus velezensis]